MMKYLLTVVTIMTTVVAMTILAPSISPKAFASDDIWMDEGDGDFDSIPEASAESPAPEGSASPEVSTAPPPAAESESYEEADEHYQAPVLVEESVPEERTQAPVQKAKIAKPAKKATSQAKKATAKKSASSAKGRFVKTIDACPMMRKPASSGGEMLVVKAERKIWIEEVDEAWVRGFNRNGEPGYINRDCVE